MDILSMFDPQSFHIAALLPSDVTLPAVLFQGILESDSEALLRSYCAFF
jgi:hypothetical protein